MIKIEKEKRYLLIPAQKALITTSVYDELTPREKLILIAYYLNIPIDNIVRYKITEHDENYVNKNTTYYILEVEIITDNICCYFNSNNNFIVSIASSNGSFRIKPFKEKMPGYEYSDVLKLKNILEKNMDLNTCSSLIVVYDTLKNKIVNYGEEEFVNRIIINDEWLDSEEFKKLTSYKNYDLVKDDEITLAVEENFKGSILSEALIYDIKKWCEKNKDYELAQDIKDVESLGGGFKGKFFVTVNGLNDYFKDMRIAILRKRKLGE